MIDGKIRRLTPTETERLMGWPEVKNSVILEICLGHQKNPVSAEIKSLKKQELVFHVGDLQQSEPVSSAKKDSSESQALSETAVDLFVEINNETKCVLLKTSQEGSASNANTAENQGWSDQVERIVRFVLGAVELPVTEVSEMRIGKEVLLQSTMPFTQVLNGKKLVKKYGKGTSDTVSDAKNDPLMVTSTISQVGPNTQNSDWLNPISFSYAIHAITGFIQEKTEASNSYLLKISVSSGWTRWGTNDKGETVEMSDTQRYKMCGNGVVSNVVAEIISSLLKDETQH